MQEFVSNLILPFFMMLGSMLSLSIGTSLAKIFLFPLVGEVGTTALRTGFSAIILITMWRPWRAQVTLGDLYYIALYGMALGVMNLCFYLSIRTIPLGLAVTIEFIGPLSVTLFYSRRLIDFIWIAFAVTGILLILPIGNNESSFDITGMFFAICAAFCWAFYIIFGKKLSHLHSGQTVAIGLIFASMVTFPVGIIDAGKIMAHSSLVLMGFLIALFSSSVPMLLEMAALKRLPHKTFGIVVSMEPAIVAIIAFFMLSEHLTFIQIIAIAFSTIAGMGSAITSGNKKGYHD